MNPCAPSSPPPTCPECLRPRRGDRCVCGWVFADPAPIFGLDDFTCRLGLAGVREARRQLAVARALRTLERDTVTAA